MTTTETTTEIFKLGPHPLDYGERVLSLPGNRVARAQIAAEAIADCTDGRWALQSPGGMDAPTREQSIVWELLRPEGGQRGTTGYQVRWHAGASS